MQRLNGLASLDILQHKQICIKYVNLTLALRPTVFILFLTYLILMQASDAVETTRK